MVATMSGRHHTNLRHHSGNSGSSVVTRGAFKGYVVTVGESNIRITRNYSSIGARDRRTKAQIENPKLERSATVLPIVASSKSAEYNCNNSSNSTNFSNQDGVQGNSPVVSSSGQSSDLGRQMSSEDLKHFERKLEREREKRINTEQPPPPRLDSRVALRYRRESLLSYYPEKFNNEVVSESGPQFDLNNLRRNGFRPTSKNSFMRDQPNVHLTAYRHGHAPPPVDPMASLSITNSGPPASMSTSGVPGALRGQSIGFGNRESSGGLNGSTMGGQGRMSNMKTRTRASFLAGQSDRYKQSQYQFHDPVAGATPDFTQRLAELTSLESDTIRYERTKKAKKKAKQDSG
ncbi:uncharacterized protein LOC121430692 isoform X1 [Lytechinus variegatus]|uniref:uncharacterized protein LOC121430692 isoform X1 n=1 Tax=Lytechinus variegatus TaxID=7654 RepID=UPI001BB2C354|nr:uncharacterized protein LOC121430692 isoform X1 [Lytechinus variegatus]XP_041483971.1 uncharacterized protein LOC121430692 isoform X1 [Lytechinus variegatus]XP_041483972.1 uncharacterized protein LOC121430692 isoform X1 [Lytechinus variegatus]